MNQYEALRAACEEQNIPVAMQAPLRDYTTFRIGGPAAALLSPRDETQLAAALRLCKGMQVPHFILGRGSNLLVADEGIDRAVIYTGQCKGLEREGNTVRACCGEMLSRLCEFAAEHALSGLEFAYGIPGTVGGALFMNAGAYGGEMKDVVLSCRYLDESGEQHEMQAQDMRLSYRHSVFAERSAVVTGVQFALIPGEGAAIRETMRSTMEKRKKKQPLQYPSAGSVFKRPPGHYAAALIEQCGLKGKQIGGAQVSEKHSGFIINRGGASAQDVRRLIAFVQETVQKQCGILLETEVLFLK